MRVHNTQRFQVLDTYKTSDLNLAHCVCCRRVMSEYRSNFKPPTRFSYVDGAWKNAAPPHLFQNKVSLGVIAACVLHTVPCAQCCVWC